MLEGAWQAANELEPQGQLEPHGAFIRADDEIELHGPVAAQARVLQGVLAHSASDPPPGGCRARHVATVADVSSAAGLVRAHVIGADNDAVLLGYELLLIGGIQ